MLSRRYSIPHTVHISVRVGFLVLIMRRLNYVLTECVELLDDHSESLFFISETNCLLKRGSPPVMNAVNKSGLVSRTYPVRDTLFFKIQGDDYAVQSAARAVKDIISRHGGTGFQFAQTEEEADTLWECRKYALMSTIASVEGSRCWTTDVWWVS